MDNITQIIIIGAVIIALTILLILNLIILERVDDAPRKERKAHKKLEKEHLKALNKND